jgi:hypothetical protein
MSIRSSRIVLASIRLVILVLSLISGPAHAGTDKAGVPLIHVTDLYRPHIDPDDHWDLACVYALARRGDVDLKAIVIDYPPAEPKGHNPDIIAVAQMNRIAGLSVPVAVGSPHPMKSRNDTQPYAGKSDLQGAQTILNVLRASEQPVLISVTGSSRDVAVAGGTDPGLFAGKCAGIYLNAGTGLSHKVPSGRLEYNVTLDKAAYAAIFDLPCPIYWLPCFEGTETDGGPVVREYASHYAFRQGEILPNLALPLRNYFACMFSRNTSCNWLSNLAKTPDNALLAEHGGKDRHMWCTAGFFHLAGYHVSADGKISPRGRASDTGVFAFEPVQTTCSDDGVTQWRPDPNSKSRFILHVRDLANYQSAMTKAMNTLLTAN